MNSPQLGLRVAGTISGLVCLAHVVRLFTQFPISLGGFAVPVWMSGFGILVAGSLAWWFWSLSRSAGSAPPAAGA